MNAARDLYEANATDYPHIRWEALAPREQEGWEYAARAAGGVSVTRHNTTPTQLTERACEVMHDAYEAAAVNAGWETQERSRKPWSDVPEANKETMRAAVTALLDFLAARGNNTAHEAIRDALEHIVTTLGRGERVPFWRLAEARAALDATPALRAALSPAPTNKDAKCGRQSAGGRCAMPAGHDGHHGQVGLR